MLPQISISIQYDSADKKSCPYNMASFKLCFVVALLLTACIIASNVQIIEAQKAIHCRTDADCKKYVPACSKCVLTLCVCGNLEKEKPQILLR
ncbi:hypothetical protein SADUNF_Sadunf03G0094700 [Salix dunnii]|uniref:Uncharacterized protein n=1 Tax=Salix dunnii TaxID=1413687 RepID=A0A835KEV0_9ROSI|nr:hypothetical protein SADUNF_Sadunf03G0094700 [Salix dunnii]